MRAVQLRLVCLAVALATVPAGAQTAPPRTVITVNAAYGTLSFQGSVDRIDLGDAWEFRPHLDVTFQHDDHVNQVDRVDLRSVLIVGSLVRGSEPAKVLFRDQRAVELTFSEFGQARHLPEVVFRVEKATVAEANHLLMGVSDERILWPIPVELR